MSNEITCLIADDHEVVREGLRLSLSRSPQIRVVGEASDGARSQGGGTCASRFSRKDGLLVALTRRLEAHRGPADRRTTLRSESHRSCASTLEPGLRRSGSE